MNLWCEAWRQRASCWWLQQATVRIRRDRLPPVNTVVIGACHGCHCFGAALILPAPCFAEGTGFDNNNFGSWSFPGALAAPMFSLSNVLAVASTAPNGERSYFSNYGKSSEHIWEGGSLGPGPALLVGTLSLRWHAVLCLPQSSRLRPPAPTSCRPFHRAPIRSSGEYEAARPGFSLSAWFRGRGAGLGANALLPPLPCPCSGTSMATPAVSAVAALLFGAAEERGLSGIGPQQVIQALMATVDPYPGADQQVSRCVAWSADVCVPWHACLFS